MTSKTQADNYGDSTIEAKDSGRSSKHASETSSKSATSWTKEVHALSNLPFSDKQDFDDAQRGFIGTLPLMNIKNARGTVWDLTTYSFLDEAPPDTINPSLWRIAQLNMTNGLFKVVERVYQVRGFDLSNMSMIEGDTGLIIIDPLISTEVAKAALELYYQHRSKRPVCAVIYTHSHADHYGGVKGVIHESDVKAGKVTVIAPQGFTEEAVSENVFVGSAMTRRSMYQYGQMLPRGPRGQVDAGLGKTASNGTFTLIPPTDIVKETGETRVVDGVQMEFQMAPDTEAPSEMLIYFPQFKVLNTAEVATHTLHNLYTPRGAQVRDAVNWWKGLHYAINAFGDKLDVVIAQHHWPTWGRERAVGYLQDQRDMFKYIHDHSLHLLNTGCTMMEVAERLKLPKSLADKWYNHDYYGSVNHNAKAVYQRYLGWYDSNPTHLWPHPPEEAAKLYVEFMGGAQAVIDKAKKTFVAGDYRWTAEVLNHVVFAEPDNQTARELEADALEQLGYQTENPTWRNEFLMGALELRHGVFKGPLITTVSADMVSAMPPTSLLDYAGIRLNATRAQGRVARIQWQQLHGIPFAIELRNCVLLYTENKQMSTPDATITCNKATFAKLVMEIGSLEKALEDGDIQITGDSGKARELFSLFDSFDSMFNIVTP